MQIRQALDHLLNDLKQLPVEESNERLKTLLEIFSLYSEMLKLGADEEFNVNVTSYFSAVSHYSLAKKLDDKVEAIKRVLKLPPGEFVMSPTAIVAQMMTSMQLITENITQLSEFDINNNDSFKLAIYLLRYNKNIGDDDQLIFDQNPGATLLASLDDTKPAEVIATQKRLREQLKGSLLNKINAYLPTWIESTQKELADFLGPFAAGVNAALEAPADGDLIAHFNKVKTQLTQLTQRDLPSYHLKHKRFSDFALALGDTVNIDDVTASFQAASLQVEDLKQQLTLKKTELEQALLNNTALEEENARQLIIQLTGIAEEKATLRATALPQVQPFSQPAPVKKSFFNRKPTTPSAAAIADAHKAMMKIEREKYIQSREIALKTELDASKNKLLASLTEKHRELGETLELKLTTIEELHQKTMALTDLPGADITDVLATTQTELTLIQENLNALRRKMSEYNVNFGFGQVDIGALEANPSQGNASVHYAQLDLTELENDLATANARANTLNALLDSDPSTKLDNPLYAEINKLKIYGEGLTPQDNEKGEATERLAKLLTLKANTYFCLPEEEKDEGSLANFKTEFSTLLHSRDDIMSAHRGYKTAIANIAIGLTGIGLLAIGIKLMLTKSLFFSQTNREMQLGHIEATATHIAAPGA